MRNYLTGLLIFATSGALFMCHGADQQQYHATITQKLGAYRINLLENLNLEKRTGMTDPASSEDLPLIIDGGCGFGTIARALATLYQCRVHAIDLRADRIQTAQKAYNPGLPITYHQGDLATYRLPEEQKAEGAFLLSVLQYIKTPSTVLKNLSTQLKRGARLLIETAGQPMPDYPFLSLAQDIAQKPEWLATPFSHIQWDCLFNATDSATLEKELEEAGYTVTAITQAPRETPLIFQDTQETSAREACAEFFTTVFKEARDIHEDQQDILHAFMLNLAAAYQAHQKRDDGTIHHNMLRIFAIAEKN